jgi:hypothetical protein
VNKIGSLKGIRRMEYALAFSFSFFMLSSPSFVVSVILTLLLFMPHRIWGINLSLAEVKFSQSENAEIRKSKTVYLLSAFLAALIALVLVIGLDAGMMTKEDADCQALAAKLHVICQQNQGEDDESE